MVLALAIGSVTGDSDPDPGPSPDAGAALSFAAPPRADVDAASCAKVLAQLPVNLGTLQPRVVRTKPDTPFVVAWGVPAVVLRCGVDRPKDLVAGSGTEAFAGGSLAGPYYFRTVGKDDTNVFTAIDRAAYISLTLPRQYNGGPLPALSRAIAKALPAVCTTENTAPLAELCTRRK